VGAQCNRRGPCGPTNGVGVVSRANSDVNGVHRGRDRPAGAPIDANGNLTSDGTRTFEWDARNQLVAVTVGTHRSEFVYDGLQRRVRQVEQENGVTTADTRVLWCETAICEDLLEALILTRGVLQQGVDPLQVGRPEFAGIGQDDFPHAALTVATTDHGASGVIGCFPGAARGPDLRKIAIGELAGDRLEAMPRLDARAHVVGQHVRHVPTAGLAVAGPVRQLQGGVLLAVRAATRGLAAPPPALGQGAKHHGPGQALQLSAERGGGDRKVA
jgi:YD repeat-containing protein